MKVGPVECAVIIAVLLITLLSLHQYGLLHVIVEDHQPVNDLADVDVSSPGQVITLEQSKVDWLRIFNFVPNNVQKCSQLFKGDSTLSNKLSVALKEHDDVAKKTAKYLEGFTAKYEHAYKAYVTLAGTPFIKTICETGFNAGHSTLGWLVSNEHAHVYSFDLREHNYSRPLANRLQKLFPGRLNVTWGDSTKTLPEFQNKHPNVTCDLIIVDGGHTTNVCQADLYNFKKMANPNNILILDNYPQKNMMNVLGNVWESAKRRGDVSEIFNCDYEHEEHPSDQKIFGFSVGRYLNL